MEANCFVLSQGRSLAVFQLSWIFCLTYGWPSKFRVTVCWTFGWVVCWTVCNVENEIVFFNKLRIWRSVENVTIILQSNLESAFTISWNMQQECFPSMKHHQGLHTFLHWAHHEVVFHGCCMFQLIVNADSKLACKIIVTFSTLLQILSLLTNTISFSTLHTVQQTNQPTVQQTVQPAVQQTVFF